MSFIDIDDPNAPPEPRDPATDDIVPPGYVGSTPTTPRRFGKLITVPRDEQYVGLTPRAVDYPDVPDDEIVTPPNFFFGTPEEPSTLGAAFRLENDIISSTDFANRKTFPPDPNYDVSEDEAVKPYIAGYLSNFIGSTSAAETRARIGRINQELRDREALNRSGVPGVLAEMAAGGLSPTILVPLGGLIDKWWRIGRIGRSGWLARIGRGVRRGAEGAALTAGALGVQEVMLQASQETRTFDQSVWNIAGGIIPGGRVRL